MNGAAVWLLPFALQGLAMAVDEFGFHRRRRVPTWEWLGHMLDTLVFLGCLAVLLTLPPGPAHLRLYALLAAGSCLLVTKDELVHKRLCSGGEQWLHAVQFILHPVVLIAAALLWLGLAGLPAAMVRAMLLVQILLAAGFMALQAAFGRGVAVRAAIDNSIYDELGERWYQARDNPVALLRAETRLRTAWVLDELKAAFGERPLAILDVACGAGLMANPMARAGHAVTGIDLSRDSLEVARRHDDTGTVRYLVQDARSLALPDAQFDVVAMMDFLEHIDDRDAVIGEAARVLKPGGRLFFHTFNRTPAAWLIAVKGVEWAVKNAPRHMHVYRLFLKPAELAEICARHGLDVGEVRGVRPRVFTWAFLQLLVTARVSDRFQFEFTRSQRVGYCGWAGKRGTA
jgi:2-polyprenyl-6-hydroxyphenyl methylase/3-demethylubiquinone-9 3-methyltransferase